MLDLCNPQVVQALLRRHGFHFSKSKGQNFLIASWVPQQIAQASGIGPDFGVLEVGPGMGSLTQQLCLLAGKVAAVEVDRSLEPVLAETLGEFQNLELLWGDVLKLDLQAVVRTHFQGLRPVACANLPYYITSPILAALLEARCFEAVTVMVQKEVAARITAAPGTSDYGAFSLFCQYCAEPEILFDVPASCFMPRPKVTSAVVRLSVRPGPPCPVINEALFFRVVRASFAQRRKTLSNALAAGFPELGKEALTDLLSSCGISPTIRGEKLDIPSFAAIANQIGEVQKG